MASKKKNKKAIKTRKCSVCHKRGHNARSHDRGGRLA